MRICKRIAPLALVCCMALGSSAAWALDGTETSATAKAPPELFTNPVQAMREGFEVLRSGDIQSSLKALEYAAQGGQSLAQWKLGRMYADGDGVPHDDLKAYQYFSQIVQSYDDDDPDRRDISVVSSAYVAVGVYSLNGISGSGIKPEPQRAFDMFQYAAINFGDPDAQYNLARMYLDGPAGIQRDAIQAARWLKLAAEKNHMEAQAVLGQLLFTGHDEVQRQRGCGLMWLAVASEAAGDVKKNTWIKDLYATALDAASPLDRQAAGVFLENYLQKRTCFR